METLLASKPSQSKNSKRYTPDAVGGILLNDVMVALESFKATRLLVFLDVAHEKLDELYDRVQREVS